MKHCKWLVCFFAVFLLLGCASTGPTLPESAPAETVQEEIPTVPELPELELPEPELPITPEDPRPSQTPETPEAPETSAKPAEEEKRDTLVCSTVNGLNIRAGKGTNYAKIGTMDAADMVMPLACDDGWYKVAYRGGVGFVSASYVTEKTFALGSDLVEKVIAQGKLYLGTPYVYGAQRYHYGNGALNNAFTTSEFDCSSLMQYIFKKGAGVNLAMTSREQSLQGKAVARASVRRGDLMFFTNASRQYKSGLERIGHVALYLGNNYILHTASDYAVIEPISAAREAFFVCARRVVD